MKLYQSNSLPSPRRIRMFLAEKGIENVEMVDVDVEGGEAREPEFLERNSLSEVPVLELDDGGHISEVTAISRYFEEIRPFPDLFGGTPGDKARVEMWLRRIESGLMGAVAAYYHHATAGFGDAGRYRNREWGENSRERATNTMRLLDGALGAEDFVAGATFSVADIAALCALDFAIACGIEIPSGANDLRAWHERVSLRESAAA